MARGPSDKLPGIGSLLALCGTILCVLFAASYFTYRSAAEALHVLADDHLSGEMRLGRADVEEVVLSELTAMESWARQPAMERILDGDADHEIDQLISTLVEQFDTISEMSCFTASGRVLISSNIRLVGKESDSAAELIERFRAGLRAEFAQAGNEVVLTVPVFVQFDALELLGALEARIANDSFVRHTPDWWAGLTSSSGEVLASHGPELGGRIELGTTEEDHPAYGTLVKTSTEIVFPDLVDAPQWRFVHVHPHDMLFGPTQTLQSVTRRMALGSGLLLAALTIWFVRRQRQLMLHLVEARDAAEHATRTKSEFLANMSHEIRTPMTAILGFAETLLDPELTSADRLNAVHTVRRNGGHLLEIINDILDISKIEAGRIVVESIKCSPVEIVADVYSLMHARAVTKGVTLELEYPGAIPESIQSDPTRLKQILVNLVGNAIKFTDSGGVRLVTDMAEAGSGESKLTFDVIDSGIGLTEAQRDGLFQAFTQADASTTRKFGGTGLGLVISRRLSEMLGGDIAVASTPGEGSTFSVTIDTGPLDGVKMLAGPLDEFLVGPAHTSPAETAPDHLDCRILLAEDGPDNQRLITHVLKRVGAEVVVVENGKLAVEAALDAVDGGHAFDVILMDMQMPVMDGYEATGQLRLKGYTGPIIALTAHAMREDREKCLRAGCSDYATKPVDRKALIETIERSLHPTHIEQT